MNSKRIIKNSQLIVYDLLRPGIFKIIIFTLFLIIMYLGIIQSWVFAGKDAGTPKPWLYDSIRNFPFWVVWIFTLIPLIPINILLNTFLSESLIFSIKISLSPLFMLGVAFYYYILSCAIYPPLINFLKSIWIKH